MELYREHGYDQTTAAQIAAKAGVTERTFFRHFTDKREVLFDDGGALRAILIEGVYAAPSDFGPWATLFHAFSDAAALLVANRHLAEPRRRIIASSPPLQERELIKAMLLTRAVTIALKERGVPDRIASLAAQVGMAAFSEAFSTWLDGSPGHLTEHLAQTFREVHDLSSHC